MKDGPWKILLVDDDEDDFVYTRSLLSDIRPGQFQLDWARNFEAGMAAFRSCEYDAYLVDYRLGDRDGLELVRQAVGGGCRAPIIVMTGQGSYAVDVEAMHAGATDYLSKGELTAPVLERTIRYAIGYKHSEKLLQQAHDELEQRVLERTRELEASKETLAMANRSLRAEIEERLKAEEALRASETRFRTLAETTSSAIFILEEMKIRYANPAVRFITGYTQDELIHHDFWMIAHPAYQEVLKIGVLSKLSQIDPAGIGGAPAAGILSRFEIKLVTKRGEERWADISIGQMAYDGKPALVLTAFDITERDQAEQALRRAKQELETRVAAYSAELAECREEIAQLIERRAGT